MLNGKRTKITGIVAILWNAACKIVPALEPVQTPINAFLGALVAWFLHDKEN